MPVPGRAVQIRPPIPALVWADVPAGCRTRACRMTWISEPDAASRERPKNGETTKSRFTRVNLSLFHDEMQGCRARILHGRGPCSPPLCTDRNCCAKASTPQQENKIAVGHSNGQEVANRTDGPVVVRAMGMVPDLRSNRKDLQHVPADRAHGAAAVHRKI